MELAKKLKRLQKFEPPLLCCPGILGFLFVTLSCFLCFLYMDFRVVSRGVRLQAAASVKPVQSQSLLQFRSFLPEKARPEFLPEFGECDLFQGAWVWDEKYPLYQSKSCPFLDDGFRCSENGRPDFFYTKWRWQPSACNLPRFDAKNMLERLRNRRLVFVGDSIGRNQWESLLCLLSEPISDKKSVYEVNGSPITKHKGFLVFKFRDFNCTVEYYRAPFLVLQSRPPATAPAKAKTTLKLDQMDWSSAQWKDADVLVFNTGHWWNYEKTIRGGCYFQEGEEVKMEMSVERAYNRSVETVVDWIGREIDTKKTQVFFRTYAPVHFRGGDWRNGGSCHLETLPELGPLQPAFKQGAMLLSAIIDVVSRTPAPEIELLNVTQMTMMRKDGHSSLYYLGPGAGPAALHRQDCSHWCLPGVPDMWNEILYAVFLRRDLARWRSSLAPSPAVQL